VPKLHQSTIRFNLWKQLRSRDDSTVYSTTIGCTIGAYEVCRNATRVEHEWATFCLAQCGAVGLSDETDCAKDAKHLRAQCRAYRHINDWPGVLADMPRATRRLSHSEYLGAALSHRFCLVARGDLLSTHKIAETMAIGGAGGCLPVLVVPQSGVQSMLPYTRWLDYCSVAFILRESDAKTRLPALIDRLREVTADEAAAKHRALAAVRAAFVFREGSSPRRPCASEFVLDEACALARLWRTRSNRSAPLSIERCML